MTSITNRYQMLPQNVSGPSLHSELEITYPTPCPISHPASLRYWQLDHWSHQLFCPPLPNTTCAERRGWHLYLQSDSSQKLDTLFYPCIFLVPQVHTITKSYLCFPLKALRIHSLLPFLTGPILI